MKEIHIIYIIFLLFILYNYFFVYEGIDFETASNNIALEKLLTQNTWTNKQTFSDDITFNKNINIGTKLCIGNTCIDEDNLKILTGDKSIYLYKPNDWNKYLYYKNDANIAIGQSSDPNDQKRKHGSWLISKNIPQSQSTCGGLTTSDSCIM